MLIVLRAPFRGRALPGRRFANRKREVRHHRWTTSRNFGGDPGNRERALSDRNRRSEGASRRVQGDQWDHHANLKNGIARGGPGGGRVKQPPGQTMAVGAIAKCLKHYGEATLITALQCVTQTTNNQSGALSARTIKALCAVLHADPERRDSGLALFEAFDSIDLLAIHDASALDAAVRKVGRVQVMADHIQAELRRLLPINTGDISQMPSNDEIRLRPPIGHQKVHPDTRFDVVNGTQR
jgi:hypothetical protein